jgi:hypothetical protein
MNITRNYILIYITFWFNLVQSGEFGYTRFKRNVKLSEVSIFKIFLLKRAATQSKGLITFSILRAIDNNRIQPIMRIPTYTILWKCHPELPENSFSRGCGGLCRV